MEKAASVGGLFLLKLICAPCPLLALSGHSSLRRTCLLFGPKRTLGVNSFPIGSVLFRARCRFSKVLPFANFHEGCRMTRLRLHPERHLVGRIGWQRAAVLGANDGIVSTASLVVGVAAAAATQSAVLVAGVAGLVAGAMSMAAGEYVSRELAIRYRTGGSCARTRGAKR